MIFIFPKKPEKIELVARPGPGLEPRKFPESVSHLLGAQLPHQASKYAKGQIFHLYQFSPILLITHPIAIPSLRTTRCQYSVATPVSAPLTLNSRTHAESNLGLWIQSANIPINIPAVVNTAMNIVPANTMYLKGIPRNVQYVMHFCAQWDNASLTKQSMCFYIQHTWKPWPLCNHWQA